MCHVILKDPYIVRNHQNMNKFVGLDDLDQLRE